VAVSTANAAGEPRILGLPEPWFYLAFGLVTAPLFGATPLVRLIGWFLSALVHEMGHSVVGCFLGMPSFPAISLTAEAVALHGDPVLVLALGIWAGLGALAWRVPRRGLRWCALATVLVVYPLCAFTGAREGLFLMGGHAGELAFGALCLQRALSGGFTDSSAERGLYSTVGWYMAGSNLWLTAGLVASAARRATYASNGSFGLTNDYIRLAEDVLGWPLELVAVLASLAALAVPLLGVLAWRLGERGTGSS
jgi:hypothetical protein